MAWYLKHYYCRDCRIRWSDEWDCLCDDTCPDCGKAHEVLSYDDLESGHAAIPTVKETVQQGTRAAITAFAAVFLVYVIAAATITHHLLTRDIAFGICALLLVIDLFYKRKEDGESRRIAGKS